MEDAQDTRALQERIDELEGKLDRLQASMDRLIAHNAAQSDFIDEMRPVTRAMMDAGAERLLDLENRGYFAFGRGALRIVDRVVEGYTTEDIDQLGDSVVAILDTVRAITQPEILALVQEGAETLEEAEEAAPIGVIGLARASGDVNVQKGLGILVAGLRHVGRASRVLSKKAKGLRQPEEGVPRRTLAQPPIHAAPPTAEHPPAMQANPFAHLGAVCFDLEGFLADREDWTPELATAIAVDLGIGTLGERHWLAIQTARRVHAESGESPNIRKLTGSCEIEVKELYQLFPHAPGKTVARIAGLPKPVGCL